MYLLRLGQNVYQLPIVLTVSLNWCNSKCCCLKEFWYLCRVFDKTPFHLSDIRKGFTSSRINYYLNSVASYQVTLLLRSGNVDPNPGPCVTDLHYNLSEQRNLKFNGLSTFYVKARIIVNKRCKLELDIAASRYDIIALTETHLDNSISDSEILPNNYLVFRRDRRSNGRRGGGVLIAVSDHIKAIPRESLQSESEFIFIYILLTSQQWNQTLDDLQTFPSRNRPECGMIWL